MLVQDGRYGLRMLRKSPGFAAAAVLTLALGIGATTAIFTLVDQVMLRSLPVARPEQLWRIGRAVQCCYSDGYTQGDGNRLPANDWSFFSWEAYQQFRDNTSGFERLAAFQVGIGQAALAVRRAGSAAPVETRIGQYVSGNFFETLGVSAWRGRFFTDADDREGAPPVAVMSFPTWQGKYGSDPAVIGSTYQLNGQPFTVIGVGPPHFVGAKIADWGMPDLWLPLATEPLIAGATSRLKNPRLSWFDLIGRVRPGTNPETLETQLQAELRRWLESHVADALAHDGRSLCRGHSRAASDACGSYGRTAVRIVGTDAQRFPGRAVHASLGHPLEFPSGSKSGPNSRPMSRNHGQSEEFRILAAPPLLPGPRESLSHVE